MQKVVLLAAGMILWMAFPSLVTGTIIPHAELENKFDSNYSGISSYSLVIVFEETDLSLRIWQQAEFWRQEWISGAGSDERIAAVAVGRGSSAVLSIGMDRAGPPVSQILFRDMDWWINAGLVSELQSYHFFYGRPALVSGMAVSTDPKPHLWMDNEEMVPLRMVFSSNGNILDLGWLEHRNVGNFKLPQKVIISNGYQEIICSMEWRDINSTYDDDLFSAHVLEESFSGFSLKPHDLIREYYRFLDVIY